MFGALRRQTAGASRRSKGPVWSALLPLLLLLSAYLMALAVAVPQHPWLGWLTLLPLLRAIQVLRPLQAASYSALWGIGLFGFGVTVVDTGIAPTIGSFALLTVIPAIYGYLGAFVTRRVGFRPLLLGFGWIMVELALRPLALRHGLLAGTQGEGSLINIVGGIFGYILVAFVVAFGSAWLLAILSNVRFSILQRVLLIGLEKASADLWQVVLPRSPLFATSPAQPRAPPGLAVPQAATGSRRCRRAQACASRGRSYQNRDEM